MSTPLQYHVARSHNIWVIPEGIQYRHHYSILWPEATTFESFQRVFNVVTTTESCGRMPQHLSHSSGYLISSPLQYLVTRSYNIWFIPEGIQCCHHYRIMWPEVTTFESFQRVFNAITTILSCGQKPQHLSHSRGYSMSSPLQYLVARSHSNWVIPEGIQCHHHSIMLWPKAKTFESF